jgi:hypothetical protein
LFMNKGCRQKIVQRSGTRSSEIRDRTQMMSQDSSRQAMQQENSRDLLEKALVGEEDGKLDRLWATAR